MSTSPGENPRGAGRRCLLASRLVRSWWSWSPTSVSWRGRVPTLNHTLEPESPRTAEQSSKGTSRIRSRRGMRTIARSPPTVAAERMGCPPIPFPPPRSASADGERRQVDVQPKTQPRPGPGKRAEAFGWRLIVVTPWEPATTTSAGHHQAGHRGGYLPYPRDVGSSDDVDGVVSTTTSRSTNTPPTRVRGCSTDSATLRANPAAFVLNREES